MNFLKVIISVVLVSILTGLIISIGLVNPKTINALPENSLCVSYHDISDQQLFNNRLKSLDDLNAWADRLNQNKAELSFIPLEQQNNITCNGGLGTYEQYSKYVELLTSDKVQYIETAAMNGAVSINNTKK